MKKRWKHGYLLLVFVFACALLMVSCKKDEQKGQPVDTSNTQMTTDDPQEITEDIGSTDETEGVETPSETATPEEGTQIDIYGINEDSLESEPARAVIKGEVNAASIVQAVVDNYAAKSIEIGIYDVSEEGDKVIVSFEYEKAPLANVGSEVEETILNCISDSLMDNLDTCKAVIFRAEDTSYESGHFAYGYDEVYASE